MTKVMVASFKDEKKAMDAFKKLNELESLGDISLYNRELGKLGEDIRRI